VPDGELFRKDDSPFGPGLLGGLVKTVASIVKARSGVGRRWSSDRLRLGQEDDVIRKSRSPIHLESVL